MKYIQLSYEDVACDNSWKEGVDKGWPALFHELIKSSKDEASKDEAMLVKYPSMWCKKAMRKESPSRKECKASIFLSVMCLSFNAPMWPKLCHLSRDRTGFLICCHFSFPQSSQPKNRTWTFQISTKCSVLAFLFPLWVLCHQLTLTFPAGNLISTLSHAFHTASVNLKHDEYCGKWIYKCWKWGTQKITKTVPSVPLCCIAQRDNCKWNSV